jgi:uncharacterized protein (DUF433 family)
MTPGVCGGRPRIAGHRIRVQDIAIWHAGLGRSAEQIRQDFPQLSLADVHAALAYYFDHRDEIDGQIGEDEDFAARLKAQSGPGPLEQKLQSQRAGGDPVSS